MVGCTVGPEDALYGMGCIVCQWGIVNERHIVYKRQKKEGALWRDFRIYMDRSR